MGTWGIGTFENDYACDLMYEFDDLASAKAMLKRILKTGKRGHKKYIDSDLGIELLVIASLSAGKVPAGQEQPENFAAASEITKGLLSEKELARLPVYVTAVVDGEKSELRELWEETDEFSKWHEGARQVLQLIPG